MKKIILSVLLLANLFLVTDSLQAQKRNLDDTWFALKNNEIERAKQSIDEAAEHETTRGTSKMHYYRAKVYLQISFLAYSDSTKRSIDPLCELKAAESFLAFLNATDKRSKGDVEELLSNIAVMGSLLINRAQYFFDKEDYLTMLTYYDQVLALIKLDKKELFLKEGTTANKLLLNMYTIANVAGDLKSARKYLNNLIDNNYKEPELYIYLARTYFDEGDSATAIKTLEDGRQIYPDDRNILIEEINYYIAKDQTDKLLEKFNEAIQNEPTNERYYFFRGTLFHQKRLYDFAEPDYLKSIELNPNAMDAKFNLGAMYVEKAAPIIDKMNVNAANLSLYDKLESEKNELYFKALPYLEDAYNSGDIVEQSEKIKLIEILRDTYKLKRDRDKIRFYQDELDKAKDGK